MSEKNSDDSAFADFGTNVSPSSPAKSYENAVPAPLAPKDRGSDEEELLKVIKLTQWAIVGPNTFKPVSTTLPQLDCGIYSVTESQFHGIIFEKKNVCIDDLLRFPDSLSDKILSEIDSFWNIEHKFKAHGFLHRRGYLFHGPAGSGKTSLVQQIIADIIKNGGLVFQCDNPRLFSLGLSLYRKVESRRPVICLFEDIDAIIERYGEDEILSLLDGENQIDRVCNIATTNYPERLDKRLCARPRRFDQVLKIGMPSKAVRKVYFKNKLKIDESELDKWADASEGFSFAACAELVISVCCFETEFNEAVKRLQDMMKANVTSADYYNNGNVGFSTKTTMAD